MPDAQEKCVTPSIKLVIVLILCSIYALPGKLQAESDTPVPVKQATPLFGARLKPVQVRIPLQLTRFQKTTVQAQPGGPAELRAVATGKQQHTLRARLDQRNHFYIQDFHIETVPMRWNPDSMSYALRLNFYRTFGHQGRLEEHLGSLDLQGTLEGDNRLYNFIGTGRADFNDNRGFRFLTVEAGQTPQPIIEPAARVSQRPEHTETPSLQ